MAENGTYGVRIRLENEDIDPAGLYSSIFVDNIYKEVLPSATPQKTPQPTAVPTAVPTVAPTTMPTTVPEHSPAPVNSPEPARTPVPSQMPGIAPGGSESNRGDDLAQENAGGENTDEEGVNQIVEKQPSPTPGNLRKPPQKETDSGSLGKKGHKTSGEKEQVIPEQAIPEKAIHETEPEIQEVEQVSLPEVKTEGSLSYQIHQKEKQGGFFTLPGVKIISITAGSALLLLGLFLLLLYLRHSVKIYNDDGEGRMLYLGRCPVRKEEELYEITIEEQMIERAYTNRYCIKPGLFRLGKREETQLAVYKEGRNVVLALAREMIAVF